MFSRLKEIFGLNNPKPQRDFVLVLDEDQAELVDWMMMTLQYPLGAEDYFMRETNGKPGELVVANASALKIWENLLACYSKGFVPRIVASERFHIEGENLVYSTICFDN